jgi:hypothetical protein
MKLTAFGLGAVLIGGAALAQDKPFAITEQRNAAVGFALAAQLIAVNVARNCAQLRDATLPDTARIEAGWIRRNGTYVEAAVAYLQYASNLVASRRGKEAGQAYYRKAQEEIQQQAGLGLRELFGAQKPDRTHCEKLLPIVASGAMDLTPMDARANEGFLPTLDELVVFHRSMIERTRKP